ncbi:MAG: hypothetical protein [Myoviridae sp. ctThM1]|nr:MAG: hypothetical protein [Myoviridae sp. ctThM1]
MVHIAQALANKVSFFSKLFFIAFRNLDSPRNSCDHHLYKLKGWSNSTIFSHAFVGITGLWPTKFLAAFLEYLTT